MGTSFLEIDRVVKSYAERPVLKNISLNIQEGEFLTLLGESGSGKTTLLRILAGFEELDSGELRLQNQRLDLLPSYKRPINTVFQSYALFPHMNVFENVAYGLKVKGVAAGDIPKRVRDALAMVKMESFETQVPTRLSGGQQQRVALARALVNQPKILLLDEPLSALDANLRHAMQVELKNLQRSLGITFLFVTHDQSEALALSDRVALLRGGELEQVASPQEIYHRPATSYVARFIGHSNVLSCMMNAGSCAWGDVKWKTPESYSGERSFSLRPEKIHLANGSIPSGGVRFSANVRSQSFEGSHILLDVVVDTASLRVQVPSSSKISESESFYFLPEDAVPLQNKGDHIKT